MNDISAANRTHQRSFGKPVMDSLNPVNIRRSIIVQECHDIGCDQFDPNSVGLKHARLGDNSMPDSDVTWLGWAGVIALHEFGHIRHGFGIALSRNDDDLVRWALLCQEGIDTLLEVWRATVASDEYANPQLVLLLFFCGALIQDRILSLRLSSCVAVRQFRVPTLAQFAAYVSKRHLQTL